MSALEENELFSIEAKADDAFFCAKPPHPALDISIWHLLTALEDMLRMPFMGMAEVSVEYIESITDRSKYALRHALAHLFRKCDAGIRLPIPEKSVPDVYERASILLQKGFDYAAVSSIFGSVHAKHATVKKREERFFLQYSRFIDARYAALEILNHGNEPFVDIVVLIYRWLKGEWREVPVLEEIVRTTKIKKKRVLYEYDPVAVLLVAELPQRPVIIPDDMIFPWGTAHETHALINSLLIRCMYHILAVNLAASVSGHRGGAESSLVLVIDKPQLCIDLSRFADIGSDKIDEFIDNLIYGYRSRTPDPALQPIIKIAGGKLLIPALHVVTCNLQRNVLSLLARLDSRNFDAQSKNFEAEMTAEIKNVLGRWPFVAVNKEFQINKQREEFDMLLVDPEKKFALILELRWLLQPGDPREVSNKSKECMKKIRKAEKKINFAERNLGEVLRKSFPNLRDIKDCEGWSVSAIVVIEGYGGILSDNEDIPLVTSEVLKVSASETEGIEDLYSWICSLEWLPVQDLHYTLGDGQIEVDGHEVNYPSIFMLLLRNSYREFVVEGCRNWMKRRNEKYKGGVLGAEA